MRDIDKQARKNAFLYCTFRDKQFALYDAFAKEKGMTMNMLLVVNALFYAKDGLTQSEICATVHHSKQTVSLIVKRLLAEGRAETFGREDDKRAKVVRLTDAGRAWAEGRCATSRPPRTRPWPCFRPWSRKRLWRFRAGSRRT